MTDAASHLLSSQPGGPPIPPLTGVTSVTSDGNDLKLQVTPGDYNWSASPITNP
jgi:hypothetical protein